MPRGGGAFLNELDGNVGATRTEAIVEIKVAGKFRGPDFEPLHFELEKVTAKPLVDSKNRPVWSVIARPINATRQEVVAAAARGDEDQVILLLDTTPGLSLKAVAEALRWVYPGQRRTKQAQGQALPASPPLGRAKQLRSKWAVPKPYRRTRIIAISVRPYGRTRYGAVRGTAGP